MRVEYYSHPHPEFRILRGEGSHKYQNKLGKNETTLLRNCL